MRRISVKKKRLFLLVCTLVVLGAGAALPAPDSQRVTILFINDLHGHLEPFMVRQGGESAEVGGIARIATLVRDIRAKNEDRGARTLVLVAGDILQGTPMSTVFMGEPDVLALNRMGADAMTVGNHEFDFGMDNLLALQKLANFPFISSNIVWKDGGDLVFEPKAVFEITDGVALTVVGATTRELLTTTKPANVQEIDVLNSVTTVKEHYASAIRNGPVVLLSHSRFVTDSLIAAEVPGLCAVIGGHDQILFDPYRKVGDVPVFQAFEKGKYLGRIELAIEPSAGTARIVSWGYIPVTQDIAPDSEVEKIVKSYASRLDSKFKEVIGENKSFLDGERDRIRYEETNLGDWVTDIMREFTGADAALINAGALRASIDRGPITVESVFKAMPYANEILVVDLSGGEVLEVLTRAVRGGRTEEDGGFLHVSGIRFEIDGKAARRVTVGGEPLDGSMRYKVAVTDFMYSGGDGYDVLVGKPAVATGLPLRELIVDTVREIGVIDAKTDGRIVRTGIRPPAE
jgi:2',3'-cyclic-nucleotide 2'-phosphodiesterase (5'-nucleotidase family)